MRRAAIALALVLGVAAPASADTMDVLKANTLVLTAQDGGTTVLLISDTGRLQQVNARGMWAAGFWSMNERGFCWTARGESEVCIPMPADKAVGDSWEIKGPTGKVAWTAEIQEGRADLEAVGEAAKAGAAVDAAASEAKE
jgi:hypothetical protein